MKRKRLTLALVAVALITAMTVGILWFEVDRTKLYTYDVSVGKKTYTITVSTNWNSAPKVYLSNSSLSDLKYVSVDFIGSSKETVFYKTTVPTDLLWGNITLVWKYYLQGPDRYALSNDGSHNYVQMTFLHQATDEHFEIRGTEGAW